MHVWNSAKCEFLTAVLPNRCYYKQLFILMVPIAGSRTCMLWGLAIKECSDFLTSIFEEYENYEGLPFK